MPFKTAKNLLYFPFSAAQILSCVYRQQRFLKTEFNQTFDEYLLNSDGTLNEKDFIKIRKYYGLAVPGVLGEAFCILRGYPMSVQERISSTCQGALTGLFDDFFDDFQLPESYLRQLIDHPELVKTEKSNEKLFIYLYTRCLKEAKSAQLVKDYFHKVLDAQSLSLRQVLPETTMEEIEKTTLFKGGISVVFYRTVFQHEMNEQEEKAMYSLGSLGQLGNDIFDIYKDLKGGIRTSVTETKDIKPIRLWFNQLVDELYQNSYAMNFPKRNIEQYIRFLNIGIHRITVCLDQLEALQAQRGGVFEPKKYERKALICDMEKPRNLLKVVWYCSNSF